MINRIKATAVRVVFRPVDPVPLEEGAKVVLSYELPTAFRPQPFAAVTKEIVRMPLEGRNEQGVKVFVGYR